jgi:hypothetical protein
MEKQTEEKVLNQKLFSENRQSAPEKSHKKLSVEKRRWQLASLAGRSET